MNANNPLQYRQIDTRSSEGIQGGIWPAPPEASNSVQFFVTVEDVQAIVKQAELLGAKLLIGPTTLPEGDEMAILLDPQQMSFGIWKPKRK